MAEEKPAVVGYAYALGFDLGNGRSIQVNGNFLQSDEPADMNAKLDRIMGVLERQRLRCQLEILEAEMKQRRKALRDNEELVARLEASMAVEFANRIAPMQKKAEVENAKIHVLKIKQDILDGEEALEEARKRAA